jgi:hypothetical protein
VLDPRPSRYRPPLWSPLVRKAGIVYRPVPAATPSLGARLFGGAAKPKLGSAADEVVGAATATQITAADVPAKSPKPEGPRGHGFAWVPALAVLTHAGHLHVFSLPPPPQLRHQDAKGHVEATRPRTLAEAIRADALGHFATRVEDVELSGRYSLPDLVAAGLCDDLAMSPEELYRAVLPSDTGTSAPTPTAGDGPTAEAADADAPKGITEEGRQEIVDDVADLLLPIDLYVSDAERARRLLVDPSAIVSAAAAEEINAAQFLGHVGSEALKHLKSNRNGASGVPQSPQSKPTGLNLITRAVDYEVIDSEPARSVVPPTFPGVDVVSSLPQCRLPLVVAISTSSGAGRDGVDTSAHVESDATFLTFDLERSQSPTRSAHIRDPPQAAPASADSARILARCEEKLALRAACKDKTATAAFAALQKHADQDAASHVVSPRIDETLPAAVLGTSSQHDHVSLSKMSTIENLGFIASAPPTSSYRLRGATSIQFAPVKHPFAFQLSTEVKGGWFSSNTVATLLLRGANQADAVEWSLAISQTCDTLRVDGS